MPVYGFCNDADGNQFNSCYSVKPMFTEEEIVMAAGTFLSASKEEEYEFDDSDGCNLDIANGKLGKNDRSSST